MHLQSATDQSQKKLCSGCVALYSIQGQSDWASGKFLRERRRSTRSRHASRSVLHAQAPRAASLGGLWGGAGAAAGRQAGAALSS
jgi:hypothetical protein